MGQASKAPKIRIGTTGACVFAITSPSPGNAGCKFPSGVREPSGKRSTPSPARKIRIRALSALRSLPSISTGMTLSFGNSQPRTGAFIKDFFARK